MSCYHPITCFYNFKEKSKVVFTRPKSDDWDLERKEISIPCGKCIGCHLDHSREWVCRLLMESKTNPHGIFLTLTYDNEHVPKYGSLRKKDLQDFFKRLRANYQDCDFKYFACGEYGANTLRPHYHIVLFGYDFEDEYISVLGERMYTNKKLAKIWGKGHISFNFINSSNIGYTTRYTLKKAIEYHERYIDPVKFGFEKEFQLQSQHLGLDYFIMNSDKILSNNGLIIFDGNTYNCPRYFLRKLNDEKTLNRIKSYRERKGKNYIMAHGSFDILKAEEDKLYKIKSLKRNKL